MQSTKKDANNKRTGLVKRKCVSLDEKIDILEKFAKTGEELNGQTVYEGYPIGQWAISIRASVNRGTTTLTQKQKDKLDAMGILKRQVDSIDAKIEALVEWNDKYPKAKMVGTDFKVIEAYSSSKEEYDRLLEEYLQMQKNYEYVRVRKSQGKLTPEQEEKCREGNVRGVFGYPTKTQELAKKYRMSVDMAEQILFSYDSMVEFVEEYFYGGEKNSPIGNKIIKNYVDIDFDTNSEGYEALVRDMYRGSRQLVVYSSKGLNEAISTLHYNDRERVEKIYGLMSGNMKSSSELLKEAGRSSTWLEQRKREIRRRLWRISRKTKIFYSNAIEVVKEEAIRTEFMRMLVDTGVIFKPAKGYEELPFDMDVETFRSKIAFYEGINQENGTIGSSEEQRNMLQEDSPNIEDKSLNDIRIPSRLYNLLVRANVNTIGELAQMTEEELKNIRGIGRAVLEEIARILAEHGLTLRSAEETLDNEQEAERVELGVQEASTKGEEIPQVEGTAAEDKSSSKQSEIARFMKNARKLAKLDERLEQARKENNEVEIQRIKSERDKVSKEIQDYLSK